MTATHKTLAAALGSFGMAAGLLLTISPAHAAHQSTGNGQDPHAAGYDNHDHHDYHKNPGSKPAPETKPAPNPKPVQGNPSPHSPGYDNHDNHDYHKNPGSKPAPETKPVGNGPQARRDFVVMYEKHGRTATIDVLANDKFTGPVKISFNTFKPGQSHSTGRGYFSVTGDNKVHYKRGELAPGIDLTYYTITDQWGRKHQSKLVIKWVRTKASAPIARNDRVRMYPGRFDVAGINVQRNDKTPSWMKVSIVKHPKIGKAEVMKNGRIRYSRKGKPVKNDVFYYKITDGQGRSSVARVAIDVE